MPQFEGKDWKVRVAKSTSSSIPFVILKRENFDVRASGRQRGLHPPPFPLVRRAILFLKKDLKLEILSPFHFQGTAPAPVTSNPAGSFLNSSLSVRSKPDPPPFFLILTQRKRSPIDLSGRGSNQLRVLIYCSNKFLWPPVCGGARRD